MIGSIDGVGRAKLQLAVARSTNIEWLKSVISDLILSIGLERSAPDNYRVDSGGADVATGTRDFCIGYASALNGTRLYGGNVGDYRVMIGHLEVWPEYGLEREREP